MPFGKFKTEREAWEAVYGPNRDPSIRQQFEAEYAERFGNLGDNWMRQFARACALPEVQASFEDSPRMRHLPQIHPRAFDIIAQYGTEYMPQVFSKPCIKDVPEGQCFRTAWASMEAWHTPDEEDTDSTPTKPLLYVEGIVVGSAVIPMLHAWNIFGPNGTKAFDWSLYSVCEWNRYIGIPLDRLEHREIFKGRATSLFARNTFEYTEEKLLQILSARAETKAA